MFDMMGAFRALTKMGLNFSRRIAKRRRSPEDVDQAIKVVMREMVLHPSVLNKNGFVRMEDMEPSKAIKRTIRSASSIPTQNGISIQASSAAGSVRSFQFLVEAGGLELHEYRSTDQFQELDGYQRQNLPALQGPH